MPTSRPSLERYPAGSRWRACKQTCVHRHPRGEATRQRRFDPRPIPSATLVKIGNADSRRLPSFGGCRRPQQGVFAALDVDRVVRDLDVLVEGADMFPPIAALSKPEASASFACQLRHGRFGVNLNSNSKAPDGLHRALLSQVTSRLLGSEDFEIVDVCHHTVVPST